MQENIVRIVYFLTLICVSCTQSEKMQENLSPQPPIAKIKDTTLVIHGHERTDPYFWLRERENPEVKAYLEAENNYADSIMVDYEPLKDALIIEMKSRIKEDDNSVPYYKQGFWHYRRFETGKEYALNCRKKENLNAVEEIVMDQNERAKSKPYYSLGLLNYSPNQQIVAFSEDTVGRREYVIRFKDLETGLILPDEIPLASSLEWAADNKTVFYTKIDPITLRVFQVYQHIIGTNVKTDRLIFEENDVLFSVNIFKTTSEKFIVINISSTQTDECRLIETEKPNMSPVIFQERLPNLEYSIDHYAGRFTIRTNFNAVNFALMYCNENQTKLNNWIPFVAHQNDVFIEDFNLFDGRAVIEERFNGLTRIKILEDKKAEPIYIDFGEPTYTTGLEINIDPTLKTLRYYYSSLTTPSSIIAYNFETGEKEILKETIVIGNFNKNNYRTERIWAKASDGTPIPISLVYHKNTPKNGTAPAYCYGYGSYGSSIDAYFSSNRLSLLDRGFVFAIFHVRGGQEMGRNWYMQGKFLKKKNTFTDFISCTKHLIDSGYIDKNKVVASGGSAGGLLMGAIINLAPELYNTVVADVPFVDVVTTMLDASIPLTTGEYEEWGNPNDKTYYEYMLSYSPYDQISVQNYPNLMVTSGFHDSQVQYWEPAKWVAKLRANKTDKNILLFKTNMEAGHGGASGRFEYLKEVAFEFAFIFKMLGIKN